MERDLSQVKAVNLDKHFNSHAHVERDQKASLYLCNPTISTHTLTWSVTDKHTTIKNAPTISTHTLTWSVT